MADLSRPRATYAAAVAARAGTRDPALIRAFATVPREAFCGPGPWRVMGEEGIEWVPAGDPAGLYRDVLVSLLPEEGINNGEPSLHATALAAAAPRPGERVVQVGAGGGYYTAILAELVGPGGCVEAYEIEPSLARMAAAALSAYPQVRVQARSGTEGALPEADLIVVNAGATEPLAPWLDALSETGRLIVPLTPDRGWGGLLLAGRRGPGAPPEILDARFLSRTRFVPCLGARSPEGERRLAAALAGGGMERVRSLRRGPVPDDEAWLAGEGWWLSRRAPSDPDRPVAQAGGSPPGA
ncbi:protein-L-isoaspartate(D-aspartate) O-methyltransferase [Methylobacterium sp. 4-46]|uniref:protein-L-isoaspartate O-methyltransferase family protein n=1 Tax=unclassified Methylobacterium TaxID=2615210 RepID=UPI000152E5E1|nr:MULTISPECIES: protein-L-isoaspartate O-methyltransferase [Methylobacterium]ACA19655.1 protein-L-isoaspartate(D-aspartate) O-methyltransferase [Methylobacterium sp. 4-46]WFT78851.1 protein-L-isoaspartate(D-aspartate) O-methyltransferase [Methylobacterium nodulans]